MAAKTNLDNEAIFRVVCVLRSQNVPDSKSRAVRFTSQVVFKPSTNDIATIPLPNDLQSLIISEFEQMWMAES